MTPNEMHIYNCLSSAIEQADAAGEHDEAKSIEKAQLHFAKMCKALQTVRELNQ